MFLVHYIITYEAVYYVLKSRHIDTDARALVPQR
jgi:hypothetical protein